MFPGGENDACMNMDDKTHQVAEHLEIGTSVTQTFFFYLPVKVRSDSGH